MGRTGWFTADRGQDWWDENRTTARTGDVTREINDDPTSITLIRSGVAQDAQTVRILAQTWPPMSREGGTAGGEQAEISLSLLGTSSLDIQKGDRFVHSSSLYEVIFVHPEQPSSGERKEAHCRQVQ